MVVADIFAVYKDVLSRLERAGLEYMIVGSVGSIVYGEPRMTHDIDIVVCLLPQHATVFAQLFPLKEFYCPPPEVLTSEIVDRGQFNLIHHDSGLKIDVMVLKNTPHAKSEFARRVQVELWQGFLAYVASPEDLILKKLDYYREGRSEKHILDIRGIIANTPLDKNYLRTWVKQMRLEEEWKSAADTDL